MLAEPKKRIEPDSNSRRLRVDPSSFVNLLISRRDLKRCNGSEGNQAIYDPAEDVLYEVAEIELLPPALFDSHSLESN